MNRISEGCLDSQWYQIVTALISWSSTCYMSMLEVVWLVSAVCYNSSFGCNRSVFSLCQLFWCGEGFESDRSVFSLRQLCGTVTSLDVRGAYFSIAIFLLIPLELICSEAHTARRVGYGFLNSRGRKAPAPAHCSHLMHCTLMYWLRIIAPTRYLHIL